MSTVSFREKNKEDYEASGKEAHTVYFCKDTLEIFMGDVQMSSAQPKPTETVQIVFTSSDNNIDFTQYTVGVREYDQAKLEYPIDASGNCLFDITMGNLYTIYFPTIVNYNFYPEVTYRASLAFRIITKEYQSLEGLIRSVILERSNPSEWATSGNESVVDSILHHGAYVIDDVHKKYAKLSSLDHTLFEDGTVWSKTYGDAFRYLPEVFYRVTTNTDNEPVLEISAYNLGAGSHSWPESWIGIYKGSVQNNVLRSLPGVLTTQNKTMTAFWECAQRHTEGQDYGLVNYFDHCKILALMYAKYGNADSSAIMGPGLQNAGQGYFTHYTGSTAQLGDTTGSMQYLSTSFFMNKMFGIEDLAGSTWEFRPNIRFTSSQCIVYEGNVVSNDAIGRTFTRTLNSANSAYITKMELGEYCDFIPKAVGGSSGNYYCDGTWASTSGQLLMVGGLANDGVICGCSAAFSNAAFDVAYSYYGSRLAFRGDISEYELVTGETMEFINN